MPDFRHENNDEEHRRWETGNWWWPVALCLADGLIWIAVDETDLRPQSRSYLLIDLLLKDR